MVSAFEGNRAETKTMLPVIEAFMAAHQLPDVTVVADAGMIGEANQQAIEAAGLSFILGMKIPHIPYVVAQWRREHRGETVTGAQLWVKRYSGPDNGEDGAVSVAVSPVGDRVFVTGLSTTANTSRDYTTIAYSG